MKRLLLLLLCSVPLLSLSAAPALPAIGQRDTVVTAFGASGDGRTPCTRAIQGAIDCLAAAGGGRVTVPAGTWLTGPIVLRSGIELHLEAGALLLFSPERADYPLVDAVFEGSRGQRCQSPISATRCHDIAITGAGIIDGNGAQWRPVKRSKTTAAQWTALTRTGAVSADAGTWYPTAELRDYAAKGNKSAQSVKSVESVVKEPAVPHDVLRPVLVSLVDCERVLLQDATFQNSPSWNVHPLMCRDVTVRGVAIRNPWYAQNGDGLDVESCRGVLVQDCTLDVGDDALCLKSGKDAEGRRRGIATEQVVIERCTVFHGHGGFVIGSEMSGGVRDVVVRQCVFAGTDTGLRFKSTRGRGGAVERITVEDIAMTDIAGDAITFDLYYGGRPGAPVPPVTEATPAFRDITMRRITCASAARALFLRGLPEMPVSRVTLAHATLTAQTAGTIDCADNITLDSVSIQAQDQSTLTITPATKHIDISGK